MILNVHCSHSWFARKCKACEQLKQVKRNLTPTTYCMRHVSDVTDKRSSVPPDTLELSHRAGLVGWCEQFSPES